MSAPAFLVGIDLGTTHCSVASVELSLGAEAPVVDFVIPQLQRPGEVVALPLLPSCLYAPGEHELPPASTRLPWGESPPRIAGAFARWQGARVPGRLIASAKSWLCHPGVDRSAPILPWGAPAEVAKVSPVEASALLLGHLAAAWNYAHPDAPLGRQEVVVTVPASFDEVARALTVEAARRAGLENLTLVEEPQAAFHDFIHHHRRDLHAVLQGVRLVLVVDTGGGTTDFTLIHVNPSATGVELRRLAVGDHLMLGGDNMDAALARHVEERWLAGGRKLSASQWTQLLQAVRAAKESLLGENPPERHGVALAAEGSRLIGGGVLSSEIQRADAERLVLEGFFPACEAGESPRRTARTALQELGLPYAQDPAITRHLAEFLRRHAGACAGALGGPVSATGLPARPDAILLNGGVFNAPALARRLVSVVSSWWPDAPPVPLLPHRSLEYAVARGAACHGLARRGLARRIGGGSAHALYVGLGGAAGTAGPQAICLIPRGREAGEPVELRHRPFQLLLGRPVQFPLYSTTSDRVDQPGDVVAVGDDFRPLPLIHTLLTSAKAGSKTAPVHLRATLTELGTLELWCVSDAGDERWRLEFELRAAESQTPAPVTESLPARFGDVRAAVERVFGHQPIPEGPREARQLFRTLEKAIGPRADWRLPWLRELWSLLHAAANRRRRSADHERVYFQLLGYSLRPGFGYPLDEWRCEETFKLLAEGVKFHAEQPVWSEFWILWRRIAGGLGEARQRLLWNAVRAPLARRIPSNASKAVEKPRGPQPEGLDEMVRMAASLEQLDAVDKAQLGGWIASRLATPQTAAGPWAWALGRLGARAPLYASSHKAVEPEQAGRWLSLLLEAGLGKVDGATFAAAQLARLTGDRSRDLPGEQRLAAAAALSAAGAPAAWARMPVELVTLEAEDEARALGDTLPIGLHLVTGARA